MFQKKITIKRDAIERENKLSKPRPDVIKTATELIKQHENAIQNDNKTIFDSISLINTIKSQLLQLNNELQIGESRKNNLNLQKIVETYSLNELLLTNLSVNANILLNLDYIRTDIETIKQTNELFDDTLSKILQS